MADTDIRRGSKKSILDARLQQLADVPDWAKSPTKPSYTHTEVGAAAASHNHSAADITSGTLPVARGGTGVTTTKDIALLSYPIGAIYMSYASTSPATLFGGTWAALGGRMLIGADGTYAAGSTGGEATHTLTAAEMPEHFHTDIYDSVNGKKITSTSGTNVNRVAPAVNGGASSGYSWKTGNAGGNAPHNNMPPYLAVYMWRRTA